MSNDSMELDERMAKVGLARLGHSVANDLDLEGWIRLMRENGVVTNPALEEADASDDSLDAMRDASKAWKKRLAPYAGRTNILVFGGLLGNTGAMVVVEYEDLEKAMPFLLDQTWVREASSIGYARDAKVTPEIIAETVAALTDRKNEISDGESSFAFLATMDEILAVL